MTEQSGLTLRWPDGSLTEGQLDAIIGVGAPFELVEETVVGCAVVGLRPPAPQPPGASRFGGRSVRRAALPRLPRSNAQLRVDGADRGRRGPPTPGPIRRGEGRPGRAGFSQLCRVRHHHVGGVLARGRRGRAERLVDGGGDGARPRTDDTARDLRRSATARTSGGTRTSDQPRSECSRMAPSTSTREPACPYPTSPWTRTSRVSCCSPAGRPAGRRRRFFPTATTSTSARPSSSVAPRCPCGRSARAQPRRPDRSPGCVISSMPLFHTSGLSGQLIAGMFTGTTTVFPEPGRWREDVHLELTQTTPGDDVVGGTDPIVEAPRMAGARPLRPLVTAAGRRRRFRLAT